MYLTIPKRYLNNIIQETAAAGFDILVTRNREKEAVENHH
jgi:hypothetical protein